MRSKINKSATEIRWTFAVSWPFKAALQATDGLARWTLDGSTARLLFLTRVDPFRIPSDLQLRLLIISAISANEKKSLCKVIRCVALDLCRLHYTPVSLAIALLYSFVLGSVERQSD